MNTPAQPIHRIADIRAFEAAAGSPTPSLMERAGEHAAQLAQQLLAGRAGPVLILCGPGNNGGDGFVMARRLRSAGVPLVVAFAGNADTLPADARAAHAAFLQSGGVTTDTLPEQHWALAVDALFGIGLRRPIAGPAAQWVAAFNALPCPRFALDIPSGLDADTGAVLEPAIRATHTLTFIALKPGLLTRDGPDLCGEIHVATLGLETDTGPGQVNAPARFAHALAPRARNSHKGCFGKVGVIGGAPGMAGAALLAARGALMTGAGRVFVGLIDERIAQLDPVQPELMLRTPHDTLALCDTLALGPGLGQSATALELTRAAIGRDLPLVLDADALNLVASHPVLARALARRNAPAVLTPHPAEAARLLGCSVEAVQANRLDAALDLAKTFRADCVLKGCGSVIAAPDARWSINRSGNPGMASAGMGDALTGITVSLIAQGMHTADALGCAVWLHGAAADACVAEGAGPVGLAASDTLSRARLLLNRLIAQHTRQ